MDKVEPKKEEKKKEPNYKLIIIIISTIIVVLGLGTYFFIGWKSYQLRKEQLKIDQIKQQNELDKQKQEEADKKKEEADKERNKTLLDICLRVAGESYSSFWNSECAILGLGDDCKLPTWNANRVDEQEEKDRAECYKRYPIN